jgi:hypothetical protein
MKELGRAIAGLVGGVLAGGAMAFAWFWITFSRSPGGIDYPQLRMLMRMIEGGALVDGLTGFAIGAKLLPRSFLKGWLLGLLMRFSLSLIPFSQLTSRQYELTFGFALVLPAAIGFTLSRRK